MIHPLKINKKVDNDAKVAQIIKENIPTAEYMSADEVNAMVAKINEMVPAINVSNGGFQGTLSINEKRVDSGFYIPQDDGKYINAGDVVVDRSKGIHFVTYDGDKWDVAVVPIVADGKVEEGNSGFVSGDTLHQDFLTIGVDFGANSSIEKVNIAPELENPNFDDAHLWRDGFFLENGVISSDTGWKSIIEFKEVYPGEFESNLYFTGNAYLVVYDINYNVVRTIGNKGHQLGTVKWKEEFSHIDKFVRFSRRTAENFDAFISQLQPGENKFNDKVFYLTSNVPALKEEINKNVEEDLDNFGLEKIEAGFNFLQELTDSDSFDENIWAKDAFLQIDGKISSDQKDFRYTKKYYEISKDIRGKKVRFRNRYNGNAKCLVYDEMGIVVQVLENTTSTYMQDKEYLLNPIGTSIRLSMRGDYTSSILLANTSIIYKNNAHIEIAKNVVSNNSQAVSSNAVASKLIEIEQLKAVERPSHPIVTFISDDGRAGNLNWFLPMIEKNNCRATLAIVGSWMDGEKGYVTMTRDEIRNCYAKGHNIAAHTFTHPRLATLSDLELDNELYKSRLSLAEIGIDAKMFVAPFGNRNTEVDKALRKYFNTDFITVNDNTIANKTCTNLPPLDRFNLKRISFDASNNTDSRLEVCKQAVDVLVEKGGWLVFAIHPHYPEYVSGENPEGYEVRRQELQDLITYIRSKEINILPANLAYEYYKNPTQIGDNRLTLQNFVIGSDGTREDTLFE